MVSEFEQRGIWGVGFVIGIGLCNLPNVLAFIVTESSSYSIALAALVLSLPLSLWLARLIRKAEFSQIVVQAAFAAAVVLMLVVLRTFGWGHTIIATIPVPTGIAILLPIVAAQLAAQFSKRGSDSGAQ